MKKIALLIVILSCISCTNYGEDGDGNGNLKHELLTEECERKPNYESWLFLQPGSKKVCYQYYDGEKFSGTAAAYHNNGTIAFIATYNKGEEVTEQRKKYDERGTLIESEIY